MKKKLLSLFLCATLAVIPFTGCAGNQNQTVGNEATQVTTAEGLNPVLEQTEDTKYKSAIKIGTTNDLPSNAPYGNNNVQTAMLTNSTFSRLVEYDAENNLVPGLATSWETNEDSTVWTFKLRDDVNFHNGEHFTAEDVKFTFEYASNTANEGINYPIIGADYINEIVIDDEYTVTFNLNKSCADWLFYAAQKIMSKNTVERDGIEVGGSIGTGAYSFVSHDTGVSWNIKRFDGYFGDQPVTEEIIFTVITDTNSRALALESGDVDAIFDPGTADIVKFMQDSNYNTFESDSLSNVFLGLNSSRPAFADQRVRQAVAMAILREDIVDACYEGGSVGSPSNNFINNVSPGYADVDAYELDIEGAKALLKEVGYDENNKLKINLYTFKKFMPIAELVQANLAMINIEVNVEEWAQSSFSSNIRKDGGYDIYIQQTSSLGGVLNIIQRFLVTDGPSNVMIYSSDELDNLYEEALASKTMDELYGKYAEIQQFIAKDVPAVPIVQASLWVIGNADFYGVELGDQNYMVNFTNCYVIEK